MTAAGMLLICMSTPTARQFCWSSACACSRSLLPEVVELERDAGQRLRFRVELRRDPLEPRHVDRARLELRVEDREVGDVLEDDALEVRRSAVVGRVRDEHEVVARDAAPELEGPGAD